MNKTEQIIYQYELARQKVASLKQERLNLIAQCENTDTCDNQHGIEITIGTLCLVNAWDEMHK